MTITSAIVLLAVIWFITLYISLPIGMKSQGDAGEVEPGTPASAPSNFQLKRKLKWVTVIALPLWLLTMAGVMYGGVTAEDLDFFSGINPVWKADRPAE